VAFSFRRGRVVSCLGLLLAPDWGREGEVLLCVPQNRTYTGSYPGRDFVESDFEIYATKYPIVCHVEKKETSGYSVEAYPGQPYIPRPKTEPYRILIEAYRGVCKMFGERVYFSEPRLSTSFVYRSEREFLESYDERFAWRVHFYESTNHNGSHAPGRYGGVLFLRPWNIHCGESRNPAKAKTHSDEVAPAICEGYLHPPQQIKLSPYFSGCFRDYGQRYGLAPFPSIPFVCAQHGGACGHSVLASALLMSQVDVTLSPYEIAVASARYAKKAAVENYGDYTIEGLTLDLGKEIVCKTCHGNFHIETFTINDRKNGFIEKADEQTFAEMICSYLYQGIPVLYPVDYSMLYSEIKDENLKAPLRRTAAHCFHMILVHSVLRAPGPAYSGLPIFVFSDSMNLHEKGSVFHQASARRLLASRLRGGQSRRSREDNFSPTYTEAPFGACVPRCLKLDYSSAQVKLRQCHRLALRDRTQIEGYLLQRVFPNVYSDPLPYRRKLDKFRLALKDLEISGYVWIAESYDGSGRIAKGEILDARSEGEPLGVFKCGDKPFVCLKANTATGQRVSVTLNMYKGAFQVGIN